MDDQTKIFLASGNPDKVKELKHMLEPLGCKVVSALDYSGIDAVEEDQPTLEGNALKKARFWRQKTGLPTLADDTGLEVDALGGEPGVLSARYAGESATYQDNVTRLLKNMEDKSDRKARFRTVIALAGEEETLFEGVCEGEIIRNPRGAGGFGYDPVFLPRGYNETFSEMSCAEKNTISHRGKALARVVEFLRIKL